MVTADATANTEKLAMDLTNSSNHDIDDVIKLLSLAETSCLRRPAVRN